MILSVLSDSFSVLTSHWRLIVGILLIMLPSQVLVGSGLRMIFGDRLTSDEYYSLSIAGWTLPILLASGLWLAWRSFQRPDIRVSALILFLSILIFAVLLFLRIRRVPLRDTKTSLFVLLGSFGLFVFLRLAFVAKATIPLYFDSAQHYLIIKNLLRGPDSPTTAFVPGLTSVYYHIGFHALAAFINSVLGADIINTMLILGQIILAVIPLTVFFLVKYETRSNLAGLFAVLLTGFGWYMPAHVMDWGKYPALTSLLPTTLTLSLAYLSIQERKSLSPRKYLSLNAILFFALIVSIFTHSRSLVIFGIVMVAWIGATAWQRLPKLGQWIFMGIILIGIAAEIQFIQTKGVLGPLFDPYFNKGLLITGIVLFLTIFAQWAYPRLAFASILAIFLLLGSLFVPVRGIPGYIDLTLLDRPFVEMILFLPFSFLGGLGLAGLEQRLQTMQAEFVLRGRNYVGFFFMVVVLGNALFRYEVYPSGCCSLVGRDDLVAMDWMDKNLPADAHVLISSTEMRVMATESFQGTVGGDAGIWIYPLIDRGTISWFYFSDFGQQATLDSLCSMGITHIYVGEIGLTFDSATISAHPEWYQILLAMPKAKVYQVIGCPKKAIP